MVRLPASNFYLIHNENNMFLLKRVGQNLNNLHTFIYIKESAPYDSKQYILIISVFFYKYINESVNFKKI